MCDPCHGRSDRRNPWCVPGLEFANRVIEHRLDGHTDRRIQQAKSLKFLLGFGNGVDLIAGRTPRGVAGSAQRPECLGNLQVHNPRDFDGLWVWLVRLRRLPPEDDLNLLGQLVGCESHLPSTVPYGNHGGRSGGNLDLDEFAPDWYMQGARRGSGRIHDERRDSVAGIGGEISDTDIGQQHLWSASAR